MTPLKKPVSRVTNGSLDGSFGPDRNRRVVVTLTPGNGRDVPDLITLRPHGTRRGETAAVIDVYRFALRCRVSRALLEKARNRKSKLAEKRAQRRLDARETRFRKKLKQTHAEQ